MASPRSDHLYGTTAEKTCVLLDSNFILVPLTLGIDIFQEIPRLMSRPIELVLLDAVRRELEELARSSGPKLRRQISSSLQSAESGCRVVGASSVGKSVDDLLVRVALENHCLVATNDRDLKRKLRRLGVPVIFVRQSSRLEIDGWAE